MNAPTVPSFTNTAETQAIVDAVVKAKFVGVDDHKSWGDKSVTLAGVGVFCRDGKQIVVALFDRSFSDYYCINEVKVDEEGVFHVTRNNCAGTIFQATYNVVADVQRMLEGYNWEFIEKHPVLTPGFIVNIEVAPQAQAVA